jgi:hypothetical protein
MSRSKAVQIAAAGAKPLGGGFRLACVLAVVAVGCSRGESCGIGNGCAGASAATADLPDADVSTTSAVVPIDSHDADALRSPPVSTPPPPTGTIQGAMPEVQASVPEQVAKPIPSTAPVAAADAAPPAEPVAPPASAAAPEKPPDEPATHAPAPSAPAPREYTSEEMMSHSAAISPRGYVLSDAGAGPFSNGAGGPTGFPSDDASAP